MKEKSKNRSGKSKRLLCLLLTVTLALVGLPIVMPERAVEKVDAADVTLKNPRIVVDDSMEAGQKVTWDCVWFGSYPQAEVIPSGVEYTALDASLCRDGDVIVSDSTYAALQSVSGWDVNNDITLDGVKYRRMKKEDATYTDRYNHYEMYYQWRNDTDYHYFKYEPIKWRMLHTDRNQVLLLSDVALDEQKYHAVYESVTWETSTVRSWLNGYGAGSNLQSIDYSQKSFIGSAFNAAERTAIADSALENADNIMHHIEGGKDTIDKVFLISESDVSYTDTAKAYGFVKNRETRDEARRCQSSAYAKAMGMQSIGEEAGNGVWWLRSPGGYEDCAMYVWSNGQFRDYGNWVINCDNCGIRPALSLNLSSLNLCTYAGTVCSDGTDMEVGEGAVTLEGDVSAQEFVKEHLDFAGSVAYQEILDRSYAKVLSTGLDTPTGKAGETMYQVLNSLSELSQGKALSIFDNPYEPILADLIQDQTETRMFDYEVEYQNQLLDGLDFLESLCDMNAGEWEANPEYKTSLEKMVKACTTDVDKNSGFYQLCAQTFGSAYGSEQIENFLKGAGISSAALDALDKYNNVVEWVVDCVNFVSLVKAYRNTSTEFKASLIAAIPYMSANLNNDNLISRQAYLGYYEAAVNKYVAFMDDDKINEFLFEEFFKKGVRRAANVFGGTVSRNTTAYLCECVGVSDEYVLAVVYAYNTGWKIGDAITKNGDNIECREFIRASYFLEDAMMDVVDASATVLKQNKTLQAARNFDASYNILQNLEVCVLETYIKYLDNQQSSWVQRLLHGAFLHKDYNLAEIEVAKVNILDWETTCCHKEKGAAEKNATASLSKICCPTDVYVYDMDGTLALSIIDGKISDKARGVTAAVVGDIKLVAVSDVSRYQVQIKASDSGNMDYIVTNLDGISGNVIQTSVFRNVRLEKGKIFDTFYQDGEVALKKDDSSVMPTAVIREKSDSILVESIDVAEKAGVKLDAGKKYQLAYRVLPANATIPTLSWTSSNKKVVRVDEYGMLTALVPGKATIQCMAIDGSQAETSVDIEVSAKTSSNGQGTSQSSVRKGQTVKIGTLKYKVSKVNADGTGEAALTGSVTKKLTALNIPDTIRIEGKNFKVTSVEKKAFQNCRKLKKVVFGKYVSAVRAQAFMGCKSLKSVQIKGKALRSISAGAFKKTSAKMTVRAKKLSKKQKAGLMKKFRKTGMSKKAKMR